MRWTYDLDDRALYVYLSDESVAGQEHMPDGVVVDVDATGRARGIEVLSPATGWDFEAVVQRFNLASGEAKFLERLASSALLTTHRPYPVGRPQTVEVDAPAETRSTNPSPSLLPAA